MSLHSGLNHLPIEHMPLDNTIPLLVLVLGFLQVCLYIILDWDGKVYSFFLGSKSSTSSLQEQSSDGLKNSGVVGEEKKKKKKQKKNQVSEFLVKQQQPGFKVDKHDESVCGEDVKLVFTSLGLLGHHDHDGARIVEERLNCNDLFNLFEEKEPSEDEVKATFDVFDQNKDGFIDANELQRLLCALGLREGSELENCRRMITAVDEDGDDKIDFIEFVKFLENTFC
ncbi:unnamed protein product [Coffea canephora]|uniref:EF-hand domain-containing protein n=1 Tax=Coffea canephora TaxID=49390 RepID=A0A068U3S2_COFCA|nr:unnamed protein product [Coffea canephora]